MYNRNNERNNHHITSRIHVKRKPRLYPIPTRVVKKKSLNFQLHPTRPATAILNSPRFSYLEPTPSSTLHSILQPLGRKITVRECVRATRGAEKLKVTRGARGTERKKCARGEEE